MTSEVTGDTLGRLLAGWRTLSGWEREGHPGHRQWNRLVDELTPLAEAAVRDPADVARLRTVAAEDPDPSVRLRARQWVRPVVPPPPSVADLARWQAHPLVGLADVDLRPEPGLALVPQPGDDAGGEDDGEVTHLLGEPLGGPWPRRRDGVPLAHLLQLELVDHPPLTARYPGLPTSGVLQFFHDLETIGDDPADGGAGAWSVRYLPDPEPLAPAARPDDVEHAAVRPARRVEPWVTWTFADPLDLDLTDEQLGRVEAARDRVVETVSTRWGALEDPGPFHAVPVLLGHGGGPSAHEAAQRLADVLPLREGDRYELLLDVPGEGPFDGWFGDLGHLEFWIRASDLGRGDLATAWALLR